MTEERLLGSGHLLAQPTRSKPSIPSPAHVSSPEPRVEPGATQLRESQKLYSHWSTIKSQPAVAPPIASASPVQLVEVRPPVSSDASRRAVPPAGTSQSTHSAPPAVKTSQASLPAPEIVKTPERPLSEVEKKARENALRRQMLRKPVCWLFKTGGFTNFFRPF